MRSSVRAQRLIARLVGAAVVGALLVAPGSLASAAGPVGSTPGLRLVDPPGAAGTGQGRPYADGVVLVGFEPGSSASARANARASVGAEAHRRISPRATDVERLTLPPGQSVEDAVRELQGRPGVRFAEPDYVLRTDATANDPGYTNNYLWGLYGPATTPSSTYGSKAGTAWAAGHIGSDDVYVAVLDTGIDVSHPDLAPNIWTNPFDPVNGLDDDGNGYVDDVHGWDFYNDDASVFDSKANDWHGTHVAGTIGAVGGNGTGVVGVNWAVTMISAKFISGEGFTSDAIAALDYVTDLKLRHGLNIVATNNSYGGPENSLAFQDAIDRGGDAGILFVAAAGNDGVDLDTTPSYPAAHECIEHYDTGDPRGWDCIVSVAAIASNGTRPSFSDYGLTTVDLGAPGASIVSTYPGAQYAESDGTSMATPHVTGALALLAACEAAPTPDGLRATLLGSVAATASLSGVTVTGGRLDVAAMTAACDAGIAPTASLSVAPDPVGGGPVDFTVWFSEAVTGVETGDFGVGGTSSGWTVSDVTGTGAGPYTVTVDAASPGSGTLFLTLAADSVDASGVSGPPDAVQSGSVMVDRAAPSASAPSAAIRTGVSLSGSIPLHLSWSGNDVGGSGVEHFELSRSSDGGATWTVVAADLTSASSDLTVPRSGTSRFRVRAVDGVGNVGPWATGPTFRPRLIQEGRSAIAYSGTWRRATSSSYSYGAVRWAKVRGNSATYSVSARSLGFVTTLSPHRGKVRIKVDGVTVATIDLYAASWTSRRVVWQRTWSKVGTHTVKIIVLGTSGRPRVDLDAFIRLK